MQLDLSPLQAVPSGAVICTVADVTHAGSISWGMVSVKVPSFCTVKFVGLSYVFVTLSPSTGTVQSQPLDSSVISPNCTGSCGRASSPVRLYRNAAVPPRIAATITATITSQSSSLRIIHILHYQKTGRRQRPAGRCFAREGNYSSVGASGIFS